MKNSKNVERVQLNQLFFNEKQQKRWEGPTMQITFCLNNIENAERVQLNQWILLEKQWKRWEGLIKPTNFEWKIIKTLRGSN